MFSPALRRLVLFVHVTTSVGFIGAAAAFLALAVAGVTLTDEAMLRGIYLGLGLVTADVLVPLCWAAVLLGILPSLGTPWGLFRYYWIVVKLVLTAIATAVLLVEARSIAAVADLAAAGGDLGSAMPARWGMIVHATGGLAVLLVLTALSVYKPRGLTPYGARRAAA
jgi:hypothetical protein